MLGNPEKEIYVTVGKNTFRAVIGSKMAYDNQVIGLGPQLAIDALAAGKAIALPEWEGFWFLAERTGVIVFTKEGQLLNTPMYDEYLMREDWSIVDGKMGSLVDPSNPSQSFIKAVRVRLDEIRDLVEGGSQSREKASASTAIQLGFMFLGLYLKQLGSDSPYKSSFNTGSSVIEKHADKASDSEVYPVMFEGSLPMLQVVMRGKYTGRPIEFDETTIVKALRKELMTIQEFINFAHVKFAAKTSGRPGSHSLFLAADEIAKAIMWLGQWLNNIRLVQEEEARQLEVWQQRKWSAAQNAYDKYCGTREWKAFNGDKLPQWDAVNEEIKAGWYAAVEDLVPNPFQYGGMVAGKPNRWY